MGFVLGEDESRDRQVGEACFGGLVDESVGNHEDSTNFAGSLRDLLGFVETSNMLTAVSSRTYCPGTTGGADKLGSISKTQSALRSCDIKKESYKLGSDRMGGLTSVSA
jgi:hypothetical protein